ncbi:MAG: glycosyltransferase family 39 protein [Anaerolineae bacterium]|nr:glycosyltransferase family 39 protein [Anaerolineae bacterium]
MLPARTRRLFPYLLLILLAGFALRLHLLGAANVWWDEAYSVWLARRPLPELARITAFDVHPLLYYTLLHGWIRLAGQSELAVRFISLIAGVLTLALAYRLGASVLSREAGALGALLLAVSRFHIWWSQEARMYVFAACWATLALWLLARQVRLRERPFRVRLGGWIAFALALAAGMYTLYLAGLVLVAASGAALILLVVRRVRWRWAVEWALAQVAALILYLPWAVYALDKIRSQAAGAEFSPDAAFSVYALLLAAGISTDIGRYLWLILPYGLLLIAALIWIGLKRRPEALALLLPAVLIPPLIVFGLTVIDWRFYRPAPEARYFLLFAPAAMLLPAALIDGLRRWRNGAGLLILLPLLTVAAWSASQHYTARYLRDQWKSAAQVLAAYARPDDAVLMVSGDRYPLFLYEYERIDGPPARAVPDGAPLLTAENVEAQMAQAAGGAERVWLVGIEAGIQDPDGLARAWLDAHYRPALSVNYDYNALVLYTIDGAQPALNDGTPWAVLPTREFRPGDTVHLGLRVEAPAVVEMIHESGLVLAARTIEASAPALLDVPFAVTQATPAGRCALRVDGQEVGQVRVTRSDPLLREADVPRQLNARLGDSIELVGMGLPRGPVRPGQPLIVDLYWRALQPVGMDYTVFVQVVGPPNPASGMLLRGQHDGPPVAGSFPTGAWPAGLIVRDRHTLSLDPAAMPEEGSYTLIAGLYDPATGVRLPVSAGPDYLGQSALDLGILTIAP